MAEVNKLGRNVPNIGADNTNAFEDGEEDGSFKRSTPGQAYGHQGSTRAEVVNCLGVTGGASGRDHGGVSAESTG